MAARRRWSSRGIRPRYCSDACRRRRVSRLDRALEQRILDLLSARASGATLCPSEVARAQAGDGDDWRELMEPTRRAARRLVAAGELVILQKGREVDASTARGAIRLGRPRR